MTQVTAAALRELERKYSRMSELRRQLPRHGDGRLTSDADRHALRSFARDFPGALRELDTLPSEEIAARLAAIVRALEGGTPQPWMEWMHAYHALMQAALRLKNIGPALVDDHLLRDLSRAHHVSISRAFADAVHCPPHGRLNALVFEEIGLRFGVPAKTVWDTLFPTRRGHRPYR